VRSAGEAARGSVRASDAVCPIPDGLQRQDALPDCYSVSSPDEEERSEAVRYTKRTIDTAARLGACAVVLHCGRVEMHDATRDLIGLLLKGKAGTEEFRLMREEAERERKERSGVFLDCCLRSLDEIVRHAQARGILLGVETRFYHREIPSFEEIGAILGRFKGSALRYWHDTGHAEIMERLGFFKVRECLDRYAEDMLGIHLHDVLGCTDHRPPSSGEIDFSLINCYVKKETVKVMEVHHPATPRDIRKGREFLEKLFDGKL